MPRTKKSSPRGSEAAAQRKRAVAAHERRIASGRDVRSVSQAELELALLGMIARSLEPASKLTLKGSAPGPDDAAAEEYRAKYALNEAMKGANQANQTIRSVMPATSAPAAPNEHSVTQALDRLRVMLDDITESSAYLRNKLEPVLLPAQPDPAGGTTGASPEPPRPAMTCAIEELTSRAREARRILNDTIGRVHLN